MNSSSLKLKSSISASLQDVADGCKETATSYVFTNRATSWSPRVTSSIRVASVHRASGSACRSADGLVRPRLTVSLHATVCRSVHKIQTSGAPTRDESSAAAAFSAASPRLALLYRAVGAARCAPLQHRRDLRPSAVLRRAAAWRPCRVAAAIHAPCNRRRCSFVKMRRRLEQLDSQSERRNLVRIHERDGRYSASVVRSVGRL